jgi:hypothetical protein
MLRLRSSAYLRLGVLGCVAAQRLNLLEDEP